MKIDAYAMRSQKEPLSPFSYEAEPGPEQVLVEVSGCGVCHTDLGFLHDGVPTRHELPLVLGHEVSGVVVAAGAGAEALQGKSVVVPAVMPCGECEVCQRGRSQICKQQVFPGNDVHGGFGSHLVVPARGLCAVDVEPGEALARLSVVADAVSTAYEAVRRGGVQEGDFAIFVGAGGVGGFGVQVASALGAKTLAIDVDDERLAQLSQHGADLTLNTRGMSTKEIKKAVKGLVKEHGLPPAEWKVFETSGTAPGQETAWSLLSFGGHLGVVGYHPGQVTLRLSNLMAFEARAEGNWGCPPARYGEVMDLVLSGRVQLEPFVELHPMSEINAVFDRLHAGELKKRPVLLPDFKGS
jgi:6-hydroxycyclohex-1-ene-1-carbonyl-CoA dehydrogenase